MYGGVTGDVRDDVFSFCHIAVPTLGEGKVEQRSEEHTSELQSRPHLVCRLLLEKKKEKRLTDRVRLLALPPPTRNPRRQAIHSSIDWSYELPPGQALQGSAELPDFVGTFGMELA